MMKDHLQKKNIQDSLIVYRGLMMLFFSMIQSIVFIYTLEYLFGVHPFVNSVIAIIMGGPIIYVSDIFANVGFSILCYIFARKMLNKKYENKYLNSLEIKLLKFVASCEKENFKVLYENSFYKGPTRVIYKKLDFISDHSFLFEVKSGNVVVGIEGFFRPITDTSTAQISIGFLNYIGMGNLLNLDLDDCIIKKRTINEFNVNLCLSYLLKSRKIS